MKTRQKTVGVDRCLCHIEDCGNLSLVDVADNIDMLSSVRLESLEGRYSHEPPNTAPPSTNIDSYGSIPTETYK
jgi:hypothetical protein